MTASVGQALREARLSKNLSVEEASKATKIRAPRIVDLENDEYMRFPNITYARSFLVLYAKFLGVDITKYPTVEAGSTVGLADYDYLQSGETPPPQPKRPEPQGPPEKPRWLIAFFVLLVMAAFGALVGWYVMNFQRLGSMENFAKKESATVATPTPVPSAAPTPTPTPTPAPSPEAAVILPPPSAATPSPSPAGAQEMEIPAPPPLNLSAVATPEPDVRRAEPMMTPGTSDDAVLAAAATPTPVPTPLATPVPTPEAAVVATLPPQGALREIKVRVTKKIKVRIVRDNPKGSSLYYGFVNPAQPVLTYSGKYFWIKATDPDALQVTIDGQPVTGGPEAGVEITQSAGL